MSSRFPFITAFIINESIKVKHGAEAAFFFFAQCLLLPAILRICHHRPLSRRSHKYPLPPLCSVPWGSPPPLFLNPWCYCTVSRGGRRFYRVCKASGGHTDCNKSAPFLTDGSGLLGEPESGGLPSRDAYLSA